MPASLPRRIVIVRLGAIGDVVNALVVASAIKSADRGVEIGWAVHPLALPLVEGHPHVDRVHLWRRGGGFAEARRIAAELRAQRYELAIDLQRILKSAWLARSSGAPRVLGFDRTRAKEASHLLTREHVGPLAGEQHMVEQYLAFARHLGLDSAAPEFKLPADARAIAWAETWVAEHGAPILVNVGATKARNQWPPERFGSLARAAAQEFGTPVALTGGPNDRERARLAMSAVGTGEGVHDLTGATSLLELAELERRSRLVATCDTGPMHLAAAVGARVVAIFGAGEPLRTGPYRQLDHIVRRRRDGSRAGLEGDERLRIEDVAVEDVMAKMRELVQLAPERARPK